MTCTVTFPEAADLARAFGNALAHASTDKARPILAAVLVEKVGDEPVRIVGSDSYTLSIEEMPLLECDGELAGLIDVDDVKNMVRILKAAKGLPGRLAFDGTDVTLELYGSTTVRRAVQGEYPRYRSIVPEAGGAGPQVAEGAPVPICLASEHLAKFAKMRPTDWRSKKRGLPVIDFELGVDELKPVRWALRGAPCYGAIMPVRRTAR